MKITSINQLDKNGSYTFADYLTWSIDQMLELIKRKLFVMSPAAASSHQSISSGLITITTSSITFSYSYKVQVSSKIGM